MLESERDAQDGLCVEMTDNSTGTCFDCNVHIVIAGEHARGPKQLDTSPQ